jgi:hypothetical protein
MASITTILGTDSVSSSRIVINNNFAAIDAELLSISNVINPNAGTLELIGLITGGNLKIMYGAIETFKVNDADIQVNVPIEFNDDVIIKKGIIHSISQGATSLPSVGEYSHSTYLLNASSFTTPKTLAAADPGQEITLISIGGSITLSNTNIVGPSQNVVILQNGSITLRYISGNFYIVSVVNCTIVY